MKLSYLVKSFQHLSNLFAYHFSLVLRSKTIKLPTLDVEQVHSAEVISDGTFVRITIFPITSALYTRRCGAAVTPALPLLHFSRKSNLMTACSKKKYSFACACIEIFLIPNPSFWKKFSWKFLSAYPTAAYKSLLPLCAQHLGGCLMLQTRSDAQEGALQPTTTQELKYLVKNINVCVGYR